jgi:hypothetical protein
MQKRDTEYDKQKKTDGTNPGQKKVVAKRKQLKTVVTKKKKRKNNEDDDDFLRKPKKKLTVAAKRRTMKSAGIKDQVPYGNDSDENEKAKAKNVDNREENEKAGSDNEEEEVILWEIKVDESKRYKDVDNSLINKKKEATTIISIENCRKEYNKVAQLLCMWNNN